MAECGDVLLIPGDTTLVEVVPDPDVTLLDQNRVTVLDNEIVDTTLVVNNQILILQSDGGSGPAGAPGSGGFATVVAGEILQALRVVYLDPNVQAFLADHDTLPEGCRVLGITQYAALTGENVQVTTEGLMVTSAMWTQGPLYLDTAGTLTSVPPLTGFHLQVATAVSATTLIVRPEVPIYLE